MVLNFVICDVFTDRPYTGNPLAIVLGADGLTTAQMQTIAREFNLSETIFVQQPVDPANTAQVRIFFPTAEIPFAGHPTIGCAIELATARAGSGDFDGAVTLEEEAGLVPVRVWRRNMLNRAEFVAPVIPCSALEARVAPVTLIAKALGLEMDDIGFAGHHPAVWQGGPRFLYAPVASLDALARARPIEPAWSEVIAAAGVDSIYLYTPGTDCDFRARMFSPTAGIPEDPATGSASAILAAQLLAAGALPDGESKLTLHQGVEMGRPSVIGLTARVIAGKLAEVRIAGSAVLVSQGQIMAPAAA